jgi:hypothetical protein
MKLLIFIGVAAGVVVLAVAPTLVSTIVSAALHSAAPSVVPAGADTTTLAQQAQASRITQIEILVTLCLLALSINGAALVLIVQFQTRILNKLRRAQVEEVAATVPTALLTNLTVQTSPNLYFTYSRPVSFSTAAQVAENARTAASA